MSTKCERCNGTGKLIAPVEAKALRSEKKLTLAKVCGKMGITVGYLSDLENGRRAWDNRLESKFRKALRSL